MIYRSADPDIGIPDISFPGLVLSRLEDHPLAPAIEDAVTGESLSAGQMADAIRRVASGLIERGLERGEVVAIISPNTIWYPVAVHAVAMAGGVFTTLNPLSTPDDVEKLLTLTRATRVIVAVSVLASLGPVLRKLELKEIIVIGDVDGHVPFASLLRAAPLRHERTRDNARDVVALPYSSGTSGLPKAVMLTNRNLVAAAMQIDSLKLVQRGERVIAVLPMFHIYGLTVFLGCTLLNGASVHSLPLFELEAFLRVIQDKRISFAPVVAPIILQLAKHPLVEHFDLSSLRAVASGASALSPELQRACKARIGVPVLNGWGLTETGTSGTALALEDAEDGIGSVGRLVRNMEMRIVEVGSTRDVAPGAEGEIWLRGPNVMQGYLGAEEATREALDAEGWLHTGDVGHVNAEGRLHVTDRAKEFIKFKGYQVSPSELEAILTSHPSVADAAVVASPDSESGEIPKAFVVKSRPVAEAELLQFVAERVAPYKKIREVEFIDRIPKTPAGKILRRILTENERAAAQRKLLDEDRIEDRIIVRRHGAVLEICLDRPRKMNAFDKDMFMGLGRALALLEDDPQLRVGVLRANGTVFTSGMDIVSAGPLAARGEIVMPEDLVDLTEVQPKARRRTKPVIAAVHGRCLNLGVELIGAADIVLAAEGTVFGQQEVARGLFPFGSATVNLAPKIGLGNALRYMLTAEEFDTEAAFRMGLVQEIVAPERLAGRALELAALIAGHSPLGVMATLASVRVARERGPRAALDLLPAEIVRLTGTADFREGVRAFVEKRAPMFSGK